MPRFSATTAEFALHSPSMSGLVSMLQRQQELLQDVLAQQTEMKKLRKLESEVLDLRSSPSSSGGSPPCKAKVRVTRDLTVCVGRSGGFYFSQLLSYIRTKCLQFMRASLRDLELIKRKAVDHIIVHTCSKGVNNAHCTCMYLYLIVLSSQFNNSP